MFKYEDYWPFMLGVFGLGGFVAVPIIWGAIGGLDYSRVLPGSLLGCAVFGYAHTRQGEFKTGRLIAAVAVAIFLIISTSRPGQGSPLMLPGGILGFIVMSACGWAGIGVGRVLAVPSVSVEDDDFGRGVKLLRDASPKAALTQFERALAAATGDQKADSLYNIAVCNVRLGQLDAAVQAIAEAIALDPSLAEEIAADDDFAPLHPTDSFRELLKSARAGATAPLNG